MLRINERENVNTEAQGSVDMNPLNIGPLPRLWFEVSPLEQSQDFADRIDPILGWVPPRPLESNVKQGPSRWYEYLNGQTNRVQPPGGQQLQWHRTYSFYSKTDRIFVYPADASQNEVGDGDGNRRIRPHPAGAQRSRARQDSTTSDEEDDDARPDTEDWWELGFQWYERGAANISHARFRGFNQTLSVHWHDQGQVSELFPSRNHANGIRPTVQQGSGGITGEIAILVALVIYSLPPDRIDQALNHCFRQRYVTHGLPPGYGWSERRGLVISIWHERAHDQGGGNAAQLSVAQKIRLFESGAYPGYGKFVF